MMLPKRDVCPILRITVALTKLELSLCKMFEVIEVVGKRGRTVPVLLTNSMSEKIALLISERMVVGVSEKNCYVFARSSYESLGHFRGSDCIRKHSALCELKNASNMRSTKLRKHVATMSQMIALRDNEIEQLADFMGHDIRVHKEYYQLPNSVLRVTKLSKLFIALEKGTLSIQQGRTLEEVSVESGT